MNAHDGDFNVDNMFHPLNEKQHDLWIYSQSTCPWANTLFSVVIAPNLSMIEVYVEPIDENADLTAMPYLPHKSDISLWTDAGNGMKHRFFEAAFMKNQMPNIGIRTCGWLDNRVEIVPSSMRVVESITKKYGAEAVLSYH